MHLVDNGGQRPSSDDINPDALEYLFAPKAPSKTPWVEIVSEGQPVIRITPEYVRLQTKVEVLKGALELTSEQLHESHRQIGRLAAEVARKDELLQELADYRAKAAIGIASIRHNQLLREKIDDLLARAELTKSGAEPVVADHPITADNYRVGKEKFAPFPFLVLITLLMLGFAATVLLTILQ